MTSKLRAKREALENLWHQGLCGKALLREHSKLVDEYLRECFLGVSVPGISESVALVALGGYGREELFPFSDIDVMILYRPEFEAELGSVTDAIFYPLWDSGLEVGHGVRTIEDGLRLASEDFFFRVSMLDARLIAGSQLLFFEMLTAYREQYVEGKRQEFVTIMEQYRAERRHKYGAHSFLLEPHIKEGKGGLRDIQSMLWTAQVVYGLEGINGIVNAGILSAEEQESFMNSWEMLVRIRNRLHYISRRKNDQLYFEQQEELADALQYKETTTSLAVEQFMRDMYGHMRTIALVTDLFFDHVTEVLGIPSGKRQYTDKVIEKGIEIRHNHIRLSASASEIAAKPQLLLRVFLAAAKYDVPVHHRAKKLISANLNCINDKVRHSSRAAGSFLGILECDCDANVIFGGMLEIGLLSAFIPEFEHIHALAQHDVYHIYTVDRHSIQALEELRLVLQERDDVATFVSSLRVLRLAVLLHDIGKGTGGDHSLAGAKIVRSIGERLGFSPEECDDLDFVVRYHLFMPESALRRDLNDTLFIKNCAEQIGTVNHLAMLYLTSIADSKATGPSAWSDWKSSLLSEMFFKIKPFLEGEHFDHLHAGRVESKVEADIVSMRSRVAELLANERDLKVDITSLASDYLLAFTPETVADHVRIHRDNYTLIQDQAVVVAVENGEQWSLLVLSRDMAGLLAKICGIMALHSLTVQNAQIFTWGDGTVVDVIEVRSTDGLRFTEKDWDTLKDDLNRAMNNRLGLGHRLYKKLSNGSFRSKELQTKRKPKVIIDNEASSSYSIIEVHATDGPGQLYRITQSLADFGVSIYKAFIATEVEQLIDVFYVLDKDGCKIEEQEFIKELSDGLYYAITQDEEKR